MKLLIENQKSGFRQVVDDIDFNKWKPDLRRLFVVVERHEPEKTPEVEQVELFQKNEESINEGVNNSADE